MHPTVVQVTQRIVERSRATRAAYLARVEQGRKQVVARGELSCANLAHTVAAVPSADKITLKQLARPNLAIVTAYNDMLSAHQPYERFPAIIREAARAAGAAAQVAGGVPAMCDGVTQGRPGMELSLFSRDTIAMATGVALSHAAFDATLALGVCDKIVPGLLIGTLAFGHLPTIFVPAGPMASGLANAEKARIRQLYAEGKVGRDALLESESAAYHSEGTCTFYGTANSNQLLLEFMGLQLPGSSFVHPSSAMRDALTKAATSRALAISAGMGDAYTPIGRLVDEKVIVNAVIGLLTSGGSTNHTLHWIAIARAAGILLEWSDFAALSQVIPLLARVYPNGDADVNHFHAAGGIGYLIGELLNAGLLHDDVETIIGRGLHRFTQEPKLIEGALTWNPGPKHSADVAVVRPVADPFQGDGGLKVLRGNLGLAVVKTSAVKPERRAIQAPALVFDSQEALTAAFKAKALERDFVAVIRFQGPRANGMPELHQLTPILGSLQDRGFKVALVTDGRMSGASGKILAAIHATPEALDGSQLARVQDGDLIEIDANVGTLRVHVSDAELAARSVATRKDPDASAFGYGRELFSVFRSRVSPADRGASVLFED
jgi:phosphogluconate dehydratase